MSTNKQSLKSKKGYDRGLTIRVSKDTLIEWEKTYQKFRLELFIHSFKKFAEKDFFRQIVLYWKEELVAAGEFHEVEENFLESVTKPGNRKTDRTVMKDESASTFFGVSREEIADYFNLMFSFIKLKSEGDVSMYSTSYFFYDFVDYAKKNVSGIIQHTKNND